MESIFLVPSFPITAPSRSGTSTSSSSSFPTHHPFPEKLGFGSRGARGRRFLVSASRRGSDGGANQRLRKDVVKRGTEEGFASVSSNNQTSTVGTPTSMAVPPPPPTYVGSPLFWIGVGVGFSALFSWVANYLKKYAMQQAFKAMMGPMAQEKGPMSNPTMFPGSAFSMPSVPSYAKPMSPSQAATQEFVTVDIPHTKVEPATSMPTSTPTTEAKEEIDTAGKQKEYSFVDISPEDVSQARSSEGFRPPIRDVPPNGSSSVEDKSNTYQQSNSTKPPGLSVEALEKMMDDPSMQKMIYPYLPEEMRNPTTFKWMLQNPQYREQLQGMLNNMQGGKEWDGQMMDSLKNFDLNSPEVKQQFDQIGLTPEQVISKIMANPDVAMSFQNPKVQAAIMDCSQDPMNIRKYQGDKEVMDVFNKISELFPGVGL